MTDRFWEVKHIAELVEGGSEAGTAQDLQEASKGAVDWLTAFGILAVTAMVTFYAFERRHPNFTLAFAGACGLASIYGFLAGTWPFGVVEAIWAFVALYRWRQISN